MPIDKPVISAELAQQAAAYATQMAQAAQEAAGLVNSLPGVTPTKTIVLRVLGAVAGVGGIVTTAVTAGTVPALFFGGISLAVYIAGLWQPSPAAVAKFGQGVAK